MILNTQSGSVSPKLTPGWKLVKITDVSVQDNPNDYIKNKITLQVTNQEIQNVLTSGSFPVDLPIWNRQNQDGSFGGEYDLLNLYRAAGCSENKIGTSQTEVALESLKGKEIMLRFNPRPGSVYVDAYPKTASPSNADESFIEYKEGQFQKDYAYQLNRYESKLASQEVLVSAPLPTNGEDKRGSSEIPF
jgi:hypothetical protein